MRLLDLDRRLVPLSRAARELGFPTAQAYRARDRRELDVYAIGARYYVRVSEARAWLESRRQRRSGDESQ
jgi:hypothetical protein